MALVDKTTLKGYFNTGDRPNEDTFIDVFDSVLSLHGSDNQTVAGDITFTGDLFISGSTSIHHDSLQTPGAGVSGAAKNEWKVNNHNGHIITTGKIDIEGLTSDSTENAAIGDEGESNAYFMKLRHEDIGYVYFVSIVCVEAPAGGEVDLDLVFDEGTFAEGAVVGGDGDTDEVIIPAAADWTAGMSRTSDNAGGTHITINGDGSKLGLDDMYVYLRVGTSSSPTNGTYTAGKYVITLMGAEEF